MPGGAAKDPTAAAGDFDKPPARARVTQAVPLPAGFSVEWGGEFESTEGALARLALVVLPVIYRMYARTAERFPVHRIVPARLRRAA